MSDSEDYSYKDNESVHSIDDEMSQIDPETHFNKILAEFELDETMVELYRVIEMHPEVDATPFVEYARSVYKTLHFWLDDDGDLVISVLPKRESKIDDKEFDPNENVKDDLQNPG